MTESDKKSRNSVFLTDWLPAITWGVAIAMVAFLCMVIFMPPADFVSAEPEIGLDQPELRPTQTAIPNVSLPPLEDIDTQQGLVRDSDMSTIQSARTRQDTVVYTVEAFDSIFAIANKFNIDPETVMWANYETLNDNPDMLSEGQELLIPPIDGVLYEWQENDTIDKVANDYFADAQDILLFSGNNLDLTNPEIEVGQMIMIPDGYREFVQWIIPTFAVGPSGVTTNVLGPGGCTVSSWTGFGSGGFIFPTNSHRLSGNDYWSGHLGIDLAVGMGEPLYAADGGMVIYSGWNSTGYGYMVLIDHGNGYQTLYAHLSSVSVACGSAVGQGQVIGFGGSTGNSTGPHLHFEVRYLGGFVNPWSVLQ